MGALILSFILMLSGGSAGGSGVAGLWHSVEPYLNYPGFEFWKFMNLAIFVAVLVKLLKKPLGDGFKAKREEIRSELIKAKQEEDAAIAQLSTVEGKLAQLQNEKAEILAEAKKEAAAESARIAKEGETEAARLKAQTTSEVERKASQIKRQLRRFSAEESVRLAEQKIKSQLSPEKDAALVKAGIQSIGGAN